MGKHLVLVGAGAAHLEFLRRWATLPAHKTAGVVVTLITRQKRFFDPLMLPYWLQAHTEPAQTAIEIEAIAHRAKAVWPNAQVAAIDTPSHTVHLSDGQAARYDWISVDLEPTQSRTLTDIAMPGARRNGLCVWPLEPFLTLWPQVLAMADSRPISLAVVADADGGFSALPLCLAVRQRLPGAAVTLVTGGLPLADGQPQALRERLAQLLRQRNITVLTDAVTALEPGDLQLQSGARLACDVPLLCTRTHAPEWLAASGLAQGALVGRDAQGGRVDSRIADAGGTSPSGTASGAVSGAVSGQPLTFADPSDHARALMAAAVKHGPARRYAAGRKTLTILPVGGGQALLAWAPGNSSAGKGWVWQGYAPGWLARRQATRLWRRCQGLG